MDDPAGRIAPALLHDTFGRSFPYVRLSLTDVCNFRCSYCLPNGYTCTEKANFLSIEEIQRLIRVLADLGVHKIRLTGGEPTIRADFTDIIQCVSAQSGIQKIAFTTNGYRLQSHAATWFAAGARFINVSVDSLNPRQFALMTGHDRLADVLAGIEAALECGYTAVKINTVLLRGFNEDEIDNFLEWIRHRPVSVRFIELMQTGDNLEYFQKHHLSAEKVVAKLCRYGWSCGERAVGDGPAQIYTHPEYCGSVGIIAPYSKNFCAGCNRLRITAKGDLRLCLFGTSGVKIRHLLQEDSQKPVLYHLIKNCLSEKKVSHFLEMGETGLTRHLASIGG